jgi:hypothetical protein
MRRITATASLAPLLLALAACAGGGAPELAGEPGALLAAREYYERRGLEDGGRCLHPKIQGQPRGELVERTADGLVLRMTYVYRDPSTIYHGTCGGSGARLFTLTRTADGPKVVEMSGPQHPAGIQYERIDDSNVW